MSRRLLCTGLLLAVLACGACAPAGQPLAPAPTPPVTNVQTVEFPRDANSHNNLLEWWYYTSHLRSANDQRDYGFEFTIFQAYRQREPSVYWLANVAVTDVDGQSFSHLAQFASAPAGAKRAGLHVDVQGWTLTGSETQDHIRAHMVAGPGAEPPFALDLTLTDLAPPVLHHNGFIDFGPAGGSYYYSRPRLAVSGELARGDAPPEPVSGQAWMDHQWGDFVVAPGTGGWDWFSLQLQDGTELMLFILRDASGGVTGVFGTRVDAHGASTDLPPGVVHVEPTGAWTSPHTGATYPSGWRLSLSEPPLALILQPRLRDQELYFPGETDAMRSLAYWEGAVSVLSESTSELLGAGYVELTGYAR